MDPIREKSHGITVMLRISIFAMISMLIIADCLVIASNPGSRKLNSSKLNSPTNDVTLVTDSMIGGSRRLLGKVEEAAQEQLEPVNIDSGHDGRMKALHLRLFHRNALESPIRKEFSSKEEMIMDLVNSDGKRIRGFLASLTNAGACETDHPYNYHSPPYGDQPDNAVVPSLSAPSPPPGASPPIKTDGVSPSPSPLAMYEEFGGRLTSGANLPGNIGQYFVEFFIGTPGQRFLFIADTGSDLVWVPCSLCPDCNTTLSMFSSSASSFLAPQLPPAPSPLSSSPPGATFFPERSSSFTPIMCPSDECNLVPPPPGATCSDKSPTSCTYAYGYSDSSQTTGIFAFDTITMTSTSGAKLEIKDVAFGCGTNNTGPSITKVGGVLGLGRGPISFPSQVGYLYGDKFSYCFTAFFKRHSSSALTFGDRHAGMRLLRPLTYTPFLTNPMSETFYYIGIEGVKLDSELLLIPPSVWAIQKDGSGGAIIDSGTTLTFFQQVAYDMIFQAFVRAIQYPMGPPTAGLDLCYNISGVEEPRFPRLSIVLKGNGMLRPPPTNYFLSPTEELRCLGLMGSPGVTVIGNLMQQNYYVEYDRLNNRLGFAKAQCSSGN